MSGRDERPTPEFIPCACGGEEIWHFQEGTRTIVWLASDKARIGRETRIGPVHVVSHLYHLTLADILVRVSKIHCYGCENELYDEFIKGQMRKRLGKLWNGRTKRE